MPAKKDQMAMGTRMQRWYANYNPERIQEQMEKFRPMYVAHAMAQFARQEKFEVCVKQVLNEAGIPVIHVVPYLCFGREVGKLKTKYSGDTLSREVAVKIGKWVARTLNEDLLWKVAADVYSVRRLQPSA
jgi:hypothetical protein